jgi:hypothetical protein
LIAGETVTAAWLAATRYLSTRDREQFNLVTTVVDPDPDLADRHVVTELNRLLERRGWQPVETVANTIFPAALARAGRYAAANRALSPLQQDRDVAAARNDARANPSVLV